MLEKKNVTCFSSLTQIKARKVHSCRKSIRAGSHADVKSEIFFAYLKKHGHEKTRLNRRLKKKKKKHPNIVNLLEAVCDVCVKLGMLLLV